MSFTADQLLDEAELRFGATELRRRVPGADENAKEGVLLKIAEGVISRVQVAGEASGQWPLPAAYVDAWPGQLLEMAIALFDLRTFAGFSAIPDVKKTLGKSAEDYFKSVELGRAGFGVGIGAGAADPSVAEPIAARNRAGENTITDGAPANALAADKMVGAGWDYTQ